MSSPEEEIPAPNLTDFNTVFDYFEAEKSTPSLEEQHDLYDSTVKNFNPTILVGPEAAEKIDRLQEEGYAIIINGNHRRFEDQFIIAAAIARNALGKMIKSRPTRILAKSPYFKKEWQRAFLHRAGAIPAFRTKDLDNYQGEKDSRLPIIREAGKRMTRLCVNLLKRRNNIVQFGSGEREEVSGKGDVQEVKKGIGHTIHLANEEGVRVAVVNGGIVYESPDDPKSARFYISPPLVGEKLEGTPEDITKTIQDDLEKAVKITAGIEPMPEGTRVLEPVEFDE